jgi:O-antigen/teichoic acid export membrane protein
MRSNAVLATTPADVGDAATVERPGVLTRRASLNAGASLLDYAARIGTGLIITPILVSGLGRTLYGVWEMLLRLGSYVSATDGRPTEALRLVIAQRQFSDDDAMKRRVVGAALAVWTLLLPLVLVAGGVLVWLAPGLTDASPALRDDVRLTTALLVASFIITSLAAVPESVLRGMNLGYRRMGWQASLHVLGGALAAGAILTGFGLVGLGLAQLLQWIATALCFWFIVRRVVPWFAAARPSRSDIRALFGMSVWLAGGDVIARVLLASDVIILGAIAGPAIVSTFVLTGYAARVSSGIHVFTTGAAIPGVGGILGSGQIERARQARRELLLLTWLFATVAGTTILLWNRSFIGLWVGPQHYAGDLINVLVVLIALQTAFIRTDSYIIDAALRPRQRVLVAGAAAALTIAASIVLTRLFGLPGLCVGFIAGRGVQSIVCPVLARRSLAREQDGSAVQAGRVLRVIRPVVVTLLLFAGATALSAPLAVSSWAAWLTCVFATGVLVSGLAIVAGTDAVARQRLLLRLGALRPGRQG